MSRYRKRKKQKSRHQSGIEIPPFLNQFGISGRLELGFDPIKAGFIILLAIYGFRGGRNYDNFLFIHNFNLLIHEAGHLIFSFFGEFISFLGGTLTQFLVPLTFTIAFWRQKQPYSASVCLFWLSINLFDISRYMKDARSQALPLLGGEAVTHDWFYLFGRTGLLTQDHTIGNFVYGIAVLTMIIAILAGLYFSRHIPTGPETD
jgi:hypothetical protein